MSELKLLEVVQYYVFVISRIQSLFCATFFSYSNDFVEKGTKNRLTWIATQNYIHMPILPYFFCKKPHSFHLLFRALTFSWLGVSKYNFFWTESCSTNLLWFWVLHSLHTSAHYLVKGTAIILKPTSFYRETLTKLMATYLLRSVHTMNLSWVDHTEWTRRLNW